MPIIRSFSPEDDDAAYASDLTRLPAINSKTIAALHRAGIFSIAQFAELSIAEMQQVKGIKSTAAGLKASALAYVHNKPIQYAPIPEKIMQRGWMLDLETLALVNRPDQIWCIGWTDIHGQSQIGIVGNREESLALSTGLTVHIVPSADAVWYTLLESLQDDDLPILHWSGFDYGIMAKSAPEPVKEALLDRMVDFHKGFIGSVRLPLKSYSIKPVAQYFGFNWEQYASWDAAERDYHHWQVTDDLELLYQACAYQRDDVLAMVTVWHQLQQFNQHHPH